MMFKRSDCETKAVWFMSNELSARQVSRYHGCAFGQVGLGSSDFPERELAMPSREFVQ